MLIKKPFKKGIRPGIASYYAAAGGDAPQTTAFLARTSGLDATHTNAYKALINGLVADGVWAKLDALWIPATQDQTTAKLNLVSASFALVENGTPTWTVDRGYTGNQSTMFLNTQYTPSTSGTNFLQNSANVGVGVSSARNTATFFNDAGATNAAQTSAIQLLPFSNQLGTGVVFFVNEATDYTKTYAAGGAYQGMWNVSRTGASTTALFKNGSAFGTPTNTTSTALVALPLWLLTTNNNGSQLGSSDDQVRTAWVGGGFSATDASNMSSRVNTFLTAVGGQIF